jgi:hypothetical protein
MAVTCAYWFIFAGSNICALISFSVNASGEHQEHMNSTPLDYSIAALVLAWLMSIAMAFVPFMNIYIERGRQSCWQIDPGMYLMFNLITFAFAYSGAAAAGAVSVEIDADDDKYTAATDDWVIPATRAKIRAGCAFAFLAAAGFFITTVIHFFMTYKFEFNLSQEGVSSMYLCSICTGSLCSLVGSALAASVINDGIYIPSYYQSLEFMVGGSFLSWSLSLLLVVYEIVRSRMGAALSRNAGMALVLISIITSLMQFSAAVACSTVSSEVPDDDAGASYTMNIAKIRASCTFAYFASFGFVLASITLCRYLFVKSGPTSKPDPDRHSEAFPQPDAEPVGAASSEPAGVTWKENATDDSMNNQLNMV